MSDISVMTRHKYFYRFQGTNLMTESSSPMVQHHPKREWTNAKCVETESVLSPLQVLGYIFSHIMQILNKQNAEESLLIP